MSTILFIFFTNLSGPLKGILGALSYNLVLLILGVYTIFSLFKVTQKLNSEQLVLLGLVSSFFCLIFLSSIITLSADFYIQKLVRLLINGGLLLFPVFVFKRNTLTPLKIIFRFITFYTFIGSVFIIVMSSFFDLSIILMNPDLPSYLVLSSIFCVGHLVNIKNNDWICILVKISTLLASLILAGRGPILFLGVCYILHFILARRIKLVFQMGASLLILLTLITITGSTFLDTIESRLLRLNTSESRSTSVFVRLQLIQTSMELIENNILIGSGFGSFGQVGMHSDMKDHPHNILLEIWSEMGVVGLTSFTSIIAAFLYLLFINLDKNEMSEILFLIFVFVFLNNLKSSYLGEAKELFAWMGIAIWFLSGERQNKLSLKGEAH